MVKWASDLLTRANTVAIAVAIAIIIGASTHLGLHFTAFARGQRPRVGSVCSVCFASGRGGVIWPVEEGAVRRVVREAESAHQPSRGMRLPLRHQNVDGWCGAVR